MAISLTASPTATGDQTGASISANLGITPKGGNTNVLVIIISWAGNPGSVVSGPTFAGASMTQITAPTQETNSAYFSAAYYLVNASHTLGTFAFTWTNSLEFSVNSAEFGGLITSAPCGALQQNGGTVQTSFTKTYTVTAGNGIFDAIYATNTHALSATTGVGQIQVSNQDNSGTTDNAESYVPSSIGTSYIAGWSVFGAGTKWIESGVELKLAPTTPARRNNVMVRH